jgi:hypothetical protein
MTSSVTVSEHDLRSVTKISDFYSARQWHATGMYSDYLRSAGIDHETVG